MVVRNWRLTWNLQSICSTFGADDVQGLSLVHWLFSCFTGRTLPMATQGAHCIDDAYELVRVCSLRGLELQTESAF